ncbi:hypothetical protein SLS62_000508 [Diatrype stigma]|uniref:C2H2-type domain-containing protein n=1 Tax=Diatrype stigma TaxID=117547 RepID=A0AAN9VC97_9PEZI
MDLNPGNGKSAEDASLPATSGAGNGLVWPPMFLIIKYYSAPGDDFSRLSQFDYQNNGQSQQNSQYLDHFQRNVHNRGDFQQDQQNLQFLGDFQPAQRYRGVFQPAQPHGGDFQPAPPYLGDFQPFQQPFQQEGHYQLEARPQQEARHQQGSQPQYGQNEARQPIPRGQPSPPQYGQAQNGQYAFGGGYPGHQYQQDPWGNLDPIPGNLEPFQHDPIPNMDQNGSPRQGTPTRAASPDQSDQGSPAQDAAALVGPRPSVAAVALQHRDQQRERGRREGRHPLPDRRPAASGSRTPNAVDQGRRPAIMLNQTPRIGPVDRNLARPLGPAPRQARQAPAPAPALGQAALPALNRGGIADPQPASPAAAAPGHVPAPAAALPAAPGLALPAAPGIVPAAALGFGPVAAPGAAPVAAPGFGPAAAPGFGPAAALPAAVPVAPPVQYPCDRCGRVFAYKNTRDSHKSIVHNTNTEGYQARQVVPGGIQCPHCDTSKPTQLAMDGHLKRHHPAAWVLEKQARQARRAAVKAAARAAAAAARGAGGQGN